MAGPEAQAATREKLNKSTCSSRCCLAAMQRGHHFRLHRRDCCLFLDTLDNIPGASLSGAAQEARYPVQVGTVMLGREIVKLSLSNTAGQSESVQGRTGSSGALSLRVSPGPACQCSVTSHDDLGRYLPSVTLASDNPLALEFASASK